MATVIDHGARIAELNRSVRLQWRRGSMLVRAIERSRHERNTTWTSAALDGLLFPIEAFGRRVPDELVNGEA